MSAHSTKRWLGPAAVLSWLSCGGMGVEGVLDPTGGLVCLPERRVCISVPIGAIESTTSVRIVPSTQAPPAALSDPYDIAATDGTKVQFLAPLRATVSFSLAFVDAGSVPSETLLRIYTLEDGDWVPLANPFVDVVRREVVGEASHLSPFVVLRADRLPDGGLPVQIDGGTRDAGTIVFPFDGGFSHPDAGKPDAGHPDAGRPDAGPPDAGQPDAGHPDAGQPDAGQPDAGHPDAGQPDAGQPDAGQPDAGQPDAGEPDAGQPDAGQPDAGQGDAGIDDAGIDAGAGLRAWSWWG